MRNVLFIAIDTVAFIREEKEFADRRGIPFRTGVAIDDYGVPFGVRKDFEERDLTIDSDHAVLLGYGDELLKLSMFDIMDAVKGVAV